MKRRIIAVSITLLGIFGAGVAVAPMAVAQPCPSNLHNVGNVEIKGVVYAICVDIVKVKVYLVPW